MKINRITDATKILLMAASIIITCILVAIGMQAANTARRVGNASNDQMQELYTDISESGIMKYDNKTVYGNEVVNFIKKYLGDYDSSETSVFSVHVTTAASPLAQIYVNNSHIPDLSDLSTVYYVKPREKFIAQVHRNENDVIDCISFTQQ